MEDIVDRLRVLDFKGPWQEAADEIERLREALKFYADFVHLPIEADIGLLMMDCGKIAYKALNERENVSSRNEM